MALGRRGGGCVGRWGAGEGQGSLRREGRSRRAGPGARGAVIAAGTRPGVARGKREVRDDGRVRPVSGGAAERAAARAGSRGGPGSWAASGWRRGSGAWGLAGPGGGRPQGGPCEARPRA